MKLDSKTVARLILLAGKTDVIHFDSTLPGFGLRLRSGGDQVRKSWVVQYRRAGRTRRLLLGSAEVLSAEQARTAAKKALGAVATGSDPQADRTARRDRDQFTFRAVADDYLGAKQPTVRPRTFVEMQRYLCGPYFKALHSSRSIRSRVGTLPPGCWSLVENVASSLPYAPAATSPAFSRGASPKD
jgi:hypothetical protein